MWQPDDYEMAVYELIKIINEDEETLGYIISEAEQDSIDEEMSKYCIPNEGIDIEPFKELQMYDVIYDVYDEDYLTDFVSCDNCPHRKHCKEQCEDAIKRIKEGKPSQYHGTTC